MMFNCRRFWQLNFVSPVFGYDHAMVVFLDGKYRRHLLENKDDMDLLEDAEGYFSLSEEVLTQTAGAGEMHRRIRIILVPKSERIPLVLAYFVDAFVPVREWRAPPDYLEGAKEAIAAWRDAVFAANSGK